MKSEMLEFLKQYIRETPPETIKSDWSQIEKMSSGGIRAAEYANLLKTKYCFDLPDPCQAEIIFEENMTPKYSGSYFLRNIVA